MPASPLHLPDLAEEKKPPLPIDEALSEAHRCLSCFDAPCTRACPTHIDVPLFIKKIASGNLLGSARTILEANILGASCARVCPTEVLCEGACVLHDVHHRPIPMGQLQRYATDHAMARGMPALVPGPRRPGSVGIIGAGPAGLACAAELLRLGYATEIYEAADQPGGLNTYGVAQYKMTPAVSLWEVDWLVRSGVTIRRGVRVGPDGDLQLDELERRHQALFIGVGMGGIPPIDLPGEELPGVLDALDFSADVKLEQAPRGMQVPLGGARVAVIGGGNTAIDVLTQARRAGAAEVWMIYRRGQDEMSAYAHEIALALAHGAKMVFQTAPLRVVGDGRVEGLLVHEVRAAGGGLQAVPGSERVLPVDAVVRATGQRGAGLWRALQDIGVRGTAGVIQVDDWGRTTNPRYWAGGDCISGCQEVVNAVAEGKRAAQGMAREVLARLPGPGTL